MRCTTELTARFALNMNLIGSPDLDAFLNDDSVPGSIEYWEAFEREEEILSRGEDGLLDALDFDTVPFEQVEDALSVELYEQDLADEAESADYPVCSCCGREDEDDKPLHYIAYQFLCESCMPRSREQRIAFRELNYKRAMRIWEKRVKTSAQFRAALDLAKQMRPDLNWDHYRYDSRTYAGPRPFLTDF
jgi:hypothetical protein